MRRKGERRDYSERIPRARKFSETKSKDARQQGVLFALSRQRQATAGAISPDSRSTMSLILLIILLLLVLGALPTWGHSRSWGYAPSSGLGAILLILLILYLLGYLRF
jgi:hypothetical protein